MPLCSLWDLSSHPGIEPRPSAVRAPRPSHWTTRKSLCYQTYLRSSFYVLSKLLLFSHWVVSLWPYGLQHTSLSCPYYFPEFAQTHVHRVDDAIQPSHPLLPLLLPSIFPSIRVFSGSVSSSHQVAKVLVSASVLPINTQDWFPLGWTGLISLQSKGLSRVFSNTTVQKLQFFGAQLSL